MQYPLNIIEVEHITDGGVDGWCIRIDEQILYENDDDSERVRMG